MLELFQSILANSEEIAAWEKLISVFQGSGKRYFLRNEILHVFSQQCYEAEKHRYFYYSSSVGKLIHYTHEMILTEDAIWLVVRPKIASQEVWRLSLDLAQFDFMSPQFLLDVSDRLVNAYEPNILEIDLSGFYETSVNINDPRNIGQGLAFLNRYLCSQMEADPEYWFELVYRALRGLQYDGINLMIGDNIPSGIDLAKQIHQAINFVSQLPPEEPYTNFQGKLEELGFAPGWGNNAQRVLETLTILDRLIDTPQPALLEAFIARVPAVFRVVLVSIHGWVAQEDVMGRDETWGQVVYVLEQARSLENKLQAEIKLAGLDVLGIQPQVIILTRLIPHCEGTFCNLRLEKVTNTDNAWILRVPFGEFNPEITNNWISKFDIWPYLESFALEAEKELLIELKGKPNLIIGNYSDGNLVAFLLARRLKVTHCNIAHSLEKPKYLFSNLYWHNLEEKYHFSLQFTADLITMNAADFIITSSSQEIVGTPESIGQYESYKFFTMPHLYHVVDGIDLFSPKFNMIPPGVNEQIFFPYSQKAERNPALTQEIKELIFHHQDGQFFGYLDEPSKQVILAIAPINSIKNLTGLAECFGASQELQAKFNLIIISTKLNVDAAINAEEAAEIQKLHDIINYYHLHGHIRWLGLRLPSYKVGEIYRLVADNQGIYVHFALFSSFGRSILEAMISGLPTFATKFGGAAEILADQDEGFIINPTDLAGTAEKILAFTKECEANSEYWQEVSRWMIERIQNKYNWQLHSNQLLALTKIYSFWNFICSQKNEARVRYMESLFHLIYKPKAERMLGSQ